MEEHKLRVSENRVLRRIFEPKREEEVGGWRMLYNKELHNLYVSPNIIRMIKSRRMKWAGHVAQMGEMINAYNILVGKPEGKRPLKADEKILEWFFEKQGGMVWTECIWLRIGLVAGPCGHSN
jgi:hypothetical protein